MIDANQHLRRRIGIEQQACNNDRQIAVASMLQQQRDNGDYPGKHRQPDIDRPATKEYRQAAAIHPDQISDGRRDQKHRFDKHPQHRVNAKALADHAVKRKGHCKNKGNPRHAGNRLGLHQHAASHNTDRRPSPSVQPLIQQHNAKHDGNQRVDEIAKGSIENLTRHDGIDKDTPIHGQHRA